MAKKTRMNGGEKMERQTIWEEKGKGSVTGDWGDLDGTSSTTITKKVKSHTSTVSSSYGTAQEGASANTSFWSRAFYWPPLCAPPPPALSLLLLLAAFVSVEQCFFGISPYPTTYYSKLLTYVSNCFIMNELKNGDWTPAIGPALEQRR